MPTCCTQVSQTCYSSWYRMAATDGSGTHLMGQAAPLIDHRHAPSGKEHALAQQVELGPAEHLPLEHLDPVHLALGLALAPDER